MLWVTPHAGVRIEIRWLPAQRLRRSVTPHAGVRIEIDSSYNDHTSEVSPPTRGCELK